MMINTKRGLKSPYEESRVGLLPAGTNDSMLAAQRQRLREPKSARHYALLLSVFLTPPSVNIPEQALRLRVGLFSRLPVRRKVFKPEEWETSKPACKSKGKRSLWDAEILNCRLSLFSYGIGPIDRLAPLGKLGRRPNQHFCWVWVFFALSPDFTIGQYKNTKE